MYKVKRTVKPGQRVILKRNFKPYGRTIHLDTANQAQLKHLYDEIHNKCIEFVPEKTENIGFVPEKTETKKVKKVEKDADKS